MAATPPRPSSPVSRPTVVVPKPGHALQISPNLEALLEHDELTRRNSSSPTSAYHTTTPEFPISLPLPPPRKTHGGRKPSQREQETPLPTTRSKEGQRRKALGSDLWPDTLPPDGSAAGQSASVSFFRPVTPNPYINPTPVLSPAMAQPHANTGMPRFAARGPPTHSPWPDEAQTPRQVARSCPDEPGSDPSRSETRGRPSPSDPFHRPSSALNKVEKILWMGRDSLSLFSGSASGLKRHDSDRRNDRAECGGFDAVQDRPMRQVSLPPAQSISRPSDSDTATLSPRPATSYPHAVQQKSNAEPSETASTRSYSIYSLSSPSIHPTPTHPPPAAHLLPRLSLPSMSHDSPRPKSVDSVTGHDYLSFIDFFSPSTSGDSNLYNIQDKSREISSSRRQPRSISIPPTSLYSPSCYNNSSTSLASMKFAPPSPTSLAVQQPLPVNSSLDSSSSVALSSMVFAPPSPSAERIPPTWLQPFSGPPSPYSPLEFAPPLGSPQEAMDEPHPTAPELASERGRGFKPGKRSVSLSPCPVHNLPSPLPPTTNHLNANVRADRIRRSRKLARVFGRTPGTDESVTEANEPRVSKKSHSPSLTALLTKQKNHRHAVSVSVSLKSPGMKTEPSTPWQTDGLWSPDGRRHSIPLTTGSFMLYVDDEQDGKAVKVPPHGHNIMDSPETASTRSFIDLSDDDDASGLGFLAPYQLRHRRLHQSSSTPSLVESLDSEAQAEADRRRKREKLARLHRFLGSRVPPEAINGCVIGPPLPPAAIPEESEHEHWLRGHKSVPSDDFDRGKEELNEKEKALNVRRAQKMERVFGTPPPQMLFHSRSSRPTVPVSQPTSPTSHNPYVLTVDIPTSSRNPNQSAYVGKTIPRRGPSESSRCLISGKDDTPQPSPSSFAQSFTDSFAGPLSGYQQVLAQSSVYLNFQHSLNSLIDIIDRDDRQSLVELHRFLHGEVDESPLEEEAAANARRASITTSLRSERRYSLPSKASMTSLLSEYHTSPQVSQFQIRRRKAAKLTNFFGVDYRELIHDVLESIEKGVEEECSQGTLQPQEVEVLMHRVRSLRAVKDPFP